MAKVEETDDEATFAPNEPEMVSASLPPDLPLAACSIQSFPPSHDTDPVDSYAISALTSMQAGDRPANLPCLLFSAPFRPLFGRSAVRRQGEQAGKADSDTTMRTIGTTPRYKNPIPATRVFASQLQSRDICATPCTLCQSCLSYDNCANCTSLSYKNFASATNSLQPQLRNGPKCTTNAIQTSLPLS